MVRKKRKIPSSKHADDVLSVKRSRQLSARLLSPAFPVASVTGWRAVLQAGVMPEACASVHLQLQALQGHRRAMLDSAKAKSKSSGPSVAPSELDSATHCRDLATFLVNLICAPSSGQFHKISGLMLDDAFRMQPKATLAAVAKAIYTLQRNWHCSTNPTTVSSSTTTITTASPFTDLTTLSDALSSLLSTSLVSKHVLSTPPLLNAKDDASDESKPGAKDLLAVKLFQTLVHRMNNELVNAGCSKFNRKWESKSLVESAFAHREQDLKQLCCVFLKFLQTTSVQRSLKMLCDEMGARRTERTDQLGALGGTEESVRALSHYLDQILRSGICAKDTLTMASMCLVLLARSFSTEKGPGTASHSRKVACGLLRGVPFWNTAHVVVGGDRSNADEALVNAKMSYSDLAKLALCRGLLKGYPVDTLTRAVPESLRPNHIEEGRAQAESLLYPILFEHVYHCCMSSTTDATRTYAFQSLQQWMSVAKKVRWNLQVLCDPEASHSEADGASSNDISKALAASILNRIQDVVLANWDHKSRTVSHMMPVIFKSLLAAQDELAEDESNLLESRMGLLQMFLSQPPGCRGTYPAMEMLLPKIGARRLLCKVPDFFPRMLHALLDPTNVSSLASHLIVTVIQQLRLEQDQHEAQSQERIAHISAYSSDSTSQMHMYDADAEDWVEHITTALTSSDSTLGKQTATYVLPPLIRQGGIENIDKAQRRRREADERSGKFIERRSKKSGRRRKRKMRAALDAGEELPAGEAAEVAFRQKHDVDFAAMILSNIRSRSQRSISSQKNQKGEELDDASLRACLHVVTAARATVVPSLAGTSKDIGSPFVDLFAYMKAQEVERALLHADPSVRFRALRLVCVSRQTSRFPTELEFGLVKQYLPLLMKRYCYFQDEANDTDRWMTNGSGSDHDCNLVGSSSAAVAAKASHSNSQSIINGGAGFGRSQMTSLLKHFFTRIHDGVESKRRAHIRVLHAQASYERKWRRTKSDIKEDVARTLSSEKQLKVDQSRAELKQRMERMVQAAVNGVGAGGYMDMGGHDKDEDEHAHGILMMFRQILPIIAKVNLNEKNEEGSALRRLCTKLLQAVLKALRSALSVVADEAEMQLSDNDIKVSKDRKIGDYTKEYLARGVVSTTGGGSKPPLRVDCRGHLLLPKKHEHLPGTVVKNEEDSEEDHLSKQHETVIVASWLLVKEGSVLLADMIDHLPLENEGSAEDVRVTSRPWLISASQVHLIGQRLVDSLLGLKHMGAISSAGQAFSIISFVSILRAEPFRGAKATLLQACVAGLVGSLVQGRNIDVSHNSNYNRTDQEGCSVRSTSSSPALSWQSRVHALNILKMIFEDSILAPDLHSWPSLFEEDVDVSNLLNRDKSKLAKTATMALVPLLCKCATTDRHFSARVMAARAVSNLTPSGVPFMDMIRSVSDKIHQLDQTYLSDTTKDHNAAHGYLLLALSLVNSLRDRSSNIAPVTASKMSAKVDVHNNFEVDVILSSICAAASRFGMNISSAALSFDVLCDSIWGILKTQGLLKKSKLCASPAVVAASISLVGELLGRSQELENTPLCTRNVDVSMYNWFTHVAVVNAKQEEQLSDAQQKHSFVTEENSSFVPSAEVRLAVAQAIRRSKILLQTKTVGVVSQLNIWDTLLGLLQDDDSLWLGQKTGEEIDQGFPHDAVVQLQW
eukprot:g2431.t1